MSITLNIQANSPKELQEILAQLAAPFGGTMPVLAAEVSNGGATLDAVVDTERAQAKPKTKAKPQENPEPADDPAPAPQQPPSNMVADKTPAQAKQEGIELLQAFFGKNPAAMNDLLGLQQKYGVSKFSDIPEAKAHDFLADAKLVSAGSPQAA